MFVREETSFISKYDLSIVCLFREHSPSLLSFRCASGIWQGLGSFVWAEFKIGSRSLYRDKDNYETNSK